MSPKESYVANLTADYYILLEGLNQILEKYEILIEMSPKGCGFVKKLEDARIEDQRVSFVKRKLLPS